jgi:hypothetical protein
MPVDTTHTLRPQKVQFLYDKYILNALNNQAITKKTVEWAPQVYLILGLLYPSNIFNTNLFVLNRLPVL